MSNLTSKLLGGVAVAIVASAVSAPAQAQTVLYSGGGTLAEKVYRDIFNCYGGTDGGDFTTGLLGGSAGCNSATAYRNVLQSYVGVGSGNGKKAFVFHDASKLTDGPRTPDAIPVPASATTGALYGTGTGASWVRDTTDSGPFPGEFHFAGSDDPLTAGDLTNYLATSGGTDLGNTGNFGAPIQLPAFSAAVSVAFHPTVGWVEKGKKVSGGSSLVNMNIDTVCAIFTGGVTQWSDNIFKANNGNTQLGNGAIKVYYRSDNSGTTFLFANALIHQCGTTSTPRAGIAHQIPDQWMTDNGLNPVAADPDSLPAAVNGFFLTVGAAGHLPANFTGAAGNGGIQGAVNANAGGVGYLSPDFALPVDTSGPKAANLQAFDTDPASPRFLPGTLAKFLPPNGKSAAAIMAKVLPPAKTAGSCTMNNTGAAGTSPDGICTHNPINFGVTSPAPKGTASYPIGGFTFIDLYTCYASASDVSAIAGTTAGSLGLFRWYFGSATDNLSVVKTQLTANAFGTIPGAWNTAAKTILTTDAKTKITAGGSGICTGKSGA